MPIYSPSGQRDHAAEYQQAVRRGGKNTEVKRAYGRAMQRALRAFAADHPDAFALYMDAERALEPALAEIDERHS